MSGRLRRGTRPDLRVAHEALSLATLAALVVHGLTLLGDGFLHPSLADVAVPFVFSYMTFWTTSGIIAFWVLALLGLSYYARTRIGVERWRGCTASPRSPGSSGSPTASARAPTRARCGSSR